MSIKYKITATSITDEKEVLVEFVCLSNDIEDIDNSIRVDPDSSIDEMHQKINDASYNIITSTISKKDKEMEREKKEKEKDDKCKVLKAAIDEEIDEEKPIKKPEKKNERRR